MRRDDRGRDDRVLRAARLAAYPPGEYVGQESFMDASEVLALGTLAGLDRGVRVLDVCCGAAGPGLLLTRSTGCDYLGVDRSPGAVALARQRARDVGARFTVARVPPLPPGRFDVVMLLETVLAFEDKARLLTALVAGLEPGGRLVLTVEEGAPLSAQEQAVMPASDTVWPWPLPDLLGALEAHGLAVRHLAEHTDAHRRRAAALLGAFEAGREELAAGLGEPPVRDLLAAHRTWVAWLGQGRIRKYAVVAERG